MKKTALEIFIEWVDTELKLKGYEHKQVIDKAQSLLPVFRQQIEEAYYQGGDDVGTGEFGGTPAYNSPSDYYTATYGQPDEEEAKEVKTLGVVCHNCKKRQATKFYGRSNDYPSCDYCFDSLNNEFDREYQ